MRAKKSADFRLIFVNRGLRIPDKSNKQEETYAGTITCYTNFWCSMWRIIPHRHLLSTLVLTYLTKNAKFSVNQTQSVNKRYSNLPQVVFMISSICQSSTLNNHRETPSVWHIPFRARIDYKDTTKKSYMQINRLFFFNFLLPLVYIQKK